ncbi:DUF2577 family protein [Paenibacillus algorifonticola]|uniref:DUF2577 family protein n=1 Tax=Paenibacillus algorifonticola TaxID=684063 RepID=UPI003D273893
MKPEGSVAQKLHDVIRQIGANKDTQLELGTVTAASPEFTVQIDGTKLELDADDCVVSERLIESGLAVDDRVILAELSDGQTYAILDRLGAF